MKEMVLLLTMFAIAQYGFSEVVKPSADMLESDLNFHHTDTVTETEKSRSANELNSNKGERDVASGKKEEKQSTNVQFWDY